MKKCRYYPSFEQAKTIVQENILVNFQWDTLYDIPFVFPCDKSSHFELEMLNVLVPQDSNTYNELLNLMEEWHNSSIIAEFKKLFKQHKGRPFDE